MRNSSIDLCKGPLLKNIIAFTIPIMLSGILQLLFNAADLVVVGRFCGSTCVGAVGATTSLIHLITNLFIGLSVGVGVGVAYGLGSGNYRGVRETVETCVPAAAICGVVMTLIGLFAAEPMLELMKTPEEQIGLSALYMKIYFLGNVPSMIYNFGSAVLRAAGDTRGPLWYLTISGVANVILNLVFVMGFGMTVDGVAYATIISQAISAALVLWALSKRQDACQLVWKEMRLYKEPIKKILTVGLPAGIQSSLFSISNVIIQSSINSFGSVVVDGSSAAGSLEGFAYTAVNAYHQTALNFAGQNMGARQYDRVKKIFGLNLICTTVTGILAAGLILGFARQLLGIYLPDSPEAVEYGIKRMLFVCLPYAFCGLMDVTTGMLRGIGSSTTPMVITVLGVCGMRIVWIYTVFQLPQCHSLEWLMASYPISWGLTFLVELLAFAIIWKKKMREAGETA